MLEAQTKCRGLFFLLPSAGLLIKEMTARLAAAAAITELIVLQADSQKSISGDFLSPEPLLTYPLQLLHPSLQTEYYFAAGPEGAI